MHIKYLCVRPEFQGSGLGSQLLRFATGEADRMGLPIYLEAASSRNAEMYARSVAFPGCSHMLTLLYTSITTGILACVSQGIMPGQVLGSEPEAVPSP